MCAHFVDGCGGCSFQHLNYTAQVIHKEKQLVDIMTRIGHFGGGFIPDDDIENESSDHNEAFNSLTYSKGYISGHGCVSESTDQSKRHGILKPAILYNDSDNDNNNAPAYHYRNKMQFSFSHKRFLTSIDDDRIKNGTARNLIDSEGTYNDDVYNRYNDNNNEN